MVKISSWSVKHIAGAREELLPPSSPTISPPWGWDKRGECTVKTNEKENNLRKNTGECEYKDKDKQSIQILYTVQRNKLMSSWLVIFNELWDKTG